MSFTLSKHDMAVYRRMLVILGCETGKLSMTMNVIGGNHIPIEWIEPLVRPSGVVQLINFKPDWENWNGVRQVSSHRWPELLNREIRKHNCIYLLSIETALDEEFKPYWNEQWVMARNVSGENVGSLSPGVPLISADVEMIEFEPFRKNLPFICPLAGNVFGKTQRSAANRAIKMTHSKLGIVNFIPWRRKILFMSDENSLMILLERLIPDSLLEKNAEDLLIRHWVRCIGRSSGIDVAEHAKNAIDLLDKLPMEGD